MDPVTAQVLLSVAKTFAVMGVGVGFQRAWKRDLSVLHDLAMRLFVPCLAFSAILTHQVTTAELASLTGAALVVLAGMLALGLATLRLLGIHQRGLLLPIVFMNSANLPFPILEANYGGVGLGYGVLFYMVVQTVLFSAGILLVSRSAELWGLLKTPVFLATVSAVLFKTIGLRVPALLIETTELIGRAAIPIILFTFGYSLGGTRLRAWRLTALASVLRLGGGLGLGLFAVALLDLTGVARDVVILQAAMPCAVVTVLLAQRHRADPELVASTVFATTLAATVMLPVLLLWLRS